ncbi:hypothetical protein, partial [Serratia nevei]|uniref:hypothetical protein n=1 Tax=Serratia nevei TaxID=2703794 RepID=UPI003FA723F8
QPGAGARCPSPGTIFRITRLWRVFRFLGYGLSIELRSMMRPRARSEEGKVQRVVDLRPR